MKRPIHAPSLQQLDFWPELKHKSMVFYAACAAFRAPARSVSEDGRTEGGRSSSKSCASAATPNGNHGDNLFSNLKGSK